MIIKIIPLLALLGMAVPSMAQLVRCNFEKCDTGYDHFFGTGFHTTCTYVCEDGLTRTSSYSHMEYACKGVKEMFRNRPNCEKELQKQREEAKKRLISVVVAVVVLVVLVLFFMVFMPMILKAALNVPDDFFA